MGVTTGSEVLMKAVRERLDSIRGSSPALLDRARVDKIYEIYVLTCLVKALKQRGANFIPCDSVGHPTTILRFRLGPGLLYGPASQPSFILVQLDGKEYEIQNSLRVVGTSGVLHELDVCLISHETADTHRHAEIDPGQRSVYFLAECKYYGSNLPLHLGREYLGLSTEFSTRAKALISNRGSLDVHNLVTRHRGTVKTNVSPYKFQGVTDLTGWISTELEQVLPK